MFVYKKSQRDLSKYYPGDITGFVVKATKPVTIVNIHYFH